MRSIALIVLIGLFSNVVAFNTCQCSNYNTEEGCTNYAYQKCFWENNACVKSSRYCGNYTTQAECQAPGCVFSGNDITAGTCSAFKQCSQVNSTQQKTKCISFGCVANSDQTIGVCNDFKNCGALTNSEDCQGLQSTTQNGQGICNWYDSSKTLNASCIAVNQCSDLPLELCENLEYPFCYKAGNASIGTQKCTNVQCNQLTSQLACAYARSQCTFGNVTVGGPLICSDNKCSSYKNEQTCTVTSNKGFCSFDGTKCQQCLNGSNGATYTSITIISALIIAALAY